MTYDSSSTSPTSHSTYIVHVAAIVILFFCTRSAFGRRFARRHAYWSPVGVFPYLLLVDRSVLSNTLEWIRRGLVADYSLTTYELIFIWAAVECTDKGLHKLGLLIHYRDYRGPLARYFSFIRI